MTASPQSRVVVTGIGLVSSVGSNRESTWQAVRQGKSRIQRISGIAGIPEASMLAATVGNPSQEDAELRTFSMAVRAAQEALQDSRLQSSKLDRFRIGCSSVADVCDTPGFFTLRRGFGSRSAALHQQGWAEHLLPNTLCEKIASQFGLLGPRFSNAAACASGSIAFLKAVQTIQREPCDVMLACSAQIIHPVIAAGFKNMRVLAEHAIPTQACRPFDSKRVGFVMGEGAAVFVCERLSHALARNASIYAEVVGGQMACDSHHMTDLSTDSTALSWLITRALKHARLAPRNIGYINAHGTGTLQNDVMETRGIRSSFGRSAERVCISSTKAVLGHLLNAAGGMELAISMLALRDGFVPPTMNLDNPDPQCDLDCLPLVGRQQEIEHAMKLSIAFGGHLAAVILRRWNEAGVRQSQLGQKAAA